MSDEEIRNLNSELKEPIRVDTGSYGLKNLHQRLRLFYGDSCGLTVEKNKDKGISVHMILKKITCADYEKEQAGRPSAVPGHAAGQ